MVAEPASRLKETLVPDYFGLFGLPRRFALDRAELERRFYALSRETHPDRFATAGAAAQRQAMERMSLLNEAYGTLKDPSELRRYFLRLEGFEEAPRAAAQQVPAELAESWFELQDALSESPEGAPAQVEAFERELAVLRVRGEEKFLAIERAIDEAVGNVPRELLQKLSDTIREGAYLKSMERDVARMVARFQMRSP